MTTRLAGEPERGLHHHHCGKESASAAGWIQRTELPVLEDSVLAKRWEAGTVTRDSLMSYSSVCSTGLDAIPLPGDISLHELESIIGDMASLAVKWHKPLSARLLPVAGKKAGDMTEFGSPYPW